MVERTVRTTERNTVATISGRIRPLRLNCKPTYEFYRVRFPQEAPIGATHLHYPRLYVRVKGGVWGWGVCVCVGGFPGFPRVGARHRRSHRI